MGGEASRQHVTPGRGQAERQAGPGASDTYLEEWVTVEVDAEGQTLRDFHPPLPRGPLDIQKSSTHPNIDELAHTRRPGQMSAGAVVSRPNRAGSGLLSLGDPLEGHGHVLRHLSHPSHLYPTATSCQVLLVTQYLRLH